MQYQNKFSNKKQNNNNFKFSKYILTIIHIFVKTIHTHIIILFFPIKIYAREYPDYRR